MDNKTETNDLTPGARYNVNILAFAINAKVDLPFDLVWLDKDQESGLKQDIQEALETVLAKFFDK